MASPQESKDEAAELATKLVHLDTGSQGSQIKESFNAGKLLMTQSQGSSSVPFRVEHLRQLRAQCIVFLAFRNGLVPRKLHLEIALGDHYPKEDISSKEVNDQKKKELGNEDRTNATEATTSDGRSYGTRENDGVPPGCSSSGTIEAEPSTNETENPKKKSQADSFSDQPELTEERKGCLAAKSKSEAKTETQETTESQEEHGLS